MKIGTGLLAAVWVQTAGGQTTTPDRDLLVQNALTRSSTDIGGSAEIYFTLTNTSGKTIDLIGVRTDLASTEALHKTNAGSNGVSRMSAVPELRVAPGATVILEPGGWHVTLIDLEKSLVEGDTRSLRLKFYDGGDVTVKVLILARNEGPMLGETSIRLNRTAGFRALPRFLLPTRSLGPRRASTARPRRGRFVANRLKPGQPASRRLDFQPFRHRVILGAIGCRARKKLAGLLRVVSH